MRERIVRLTYSVDENRSLFSLVVARFRPVEEGFGGLLIIRVCLYRWLSTRGKTKDGGSYRVYNDVRGSSKLGKLVEISQGCDYSIDAKSVQQFGLLGTANECSDFKRIPLGMIK